MDKLKNKDTDLLFESILKLKTKNECYNFFKDLCTVKEIMDMSKRLKAAIYLYDKKSYKDILNEIDISSATLSRVSRCLNFGEGGYAKMIAQIKGEKHYEKE